MDLLQEMSYDECRQRLEEQTVGRVAMCTPSGPQIVPVNYIVDGETLVFRTVPYGVLATYARGNQLAFEVDRLDRENRSGWSVVATGRSTVVEDPEAIARFRADTGPTPWAGGSRMLFVRLPWRTLTGRTVGARSTASRAATP
jgi:nitroimidazol reductase NimA-like FMN-containing flavoprotein (pyridoxamine 5'-phosphate oxidase superfamily)